MPLKSTINHSRRHELIFALGGARGGGGRLTIALFFRACITEKMVCSRSQQTGIELRQRLCLLHLTVQRSTAVICTCTIPRTRVEGGGRGIRLPSVVVRRGRWFGF